LIQKERLGIRQKSLNIKPPSPIKDITTRELIKITTGKDPYKCNRCGIGEMVIIKIFPPIRGYPARARIRGAPKDRKVDLG
jgi:hypothetical protein